MATRRTHREMYERFSFTNPVTEELLQEVQAHLEAVVEEGTTTERLTFAEQLARGIGSRVIVHRDENARRAQELLAGLTEDDSQKWLDLLFQAVADYLRFEREQGALSEGES